jgi:hypothetical protein
MKVGGAMTPSRLRGFGKILIIINGVFIADGPGKHHDVPRFNRKFFNSHVNSFLFQYSLNLVP